MPKSTTHKEGKDNNNKKKTDLFASSKNDYNTLEYLLRSYVGPFVLLFVTPVFLNVATYAVLKDDGKLLTMLSKLNLDYVRDSFVFPTYRITVATFLFCLFETFLFVVIPGNEYLGPRAPSGFVPRYRSNGGACFTITFFTYFYLYH